MDNIVTILKEIAAYVLGTLTYSAIPLLLGVIVAAVIKVHVNEEKLKTTLIKASNVSNVGGVIFGSLTPFSACATPAIIMALMATSLPWGPVMAFLTSSPLMSPDRFIMVSGILGLKFAIALIMASIIIGLGSGYITSFIETKTNFLNDQRRFKDQANSVQKCCKKSPPVEAAYCSKLNLDEEMPLKNLNTAACLEKSYTTSINEFLKKIKFTQMFNFFIDVGVKQILVNFAMFATLAYFVSKFTPAEVIMGYLGKGNIFAVPLTAIAGLPLYVSTSSSLPLLNMLIDNGAGGGAMLAFMITGPGTSAGTLAGLATVMKRRALGLYVMFLLIGSIVAGYLYDFLLLNGM